MFEYIGSDTMRRIRASQYCPPNATSYTVLPGDNLSTLARRFGTTVPAIEAANPGVSLTPLRAGSEICIPRQPFYSPCPGGAYYIVRPGETLEALARRYNVPASRLREANPHLLHDLLAIGQVICIPR